MQTVPCGCQIKKLFIPKSTPPLIKIVCFSVLLLKYLLSYILFIYNTYDNSVHFVKSNNYKKYIHKSIYHN